MKLLLLLLAVIKSSGSIKIACDYDYTCTIEQLTTSQQLHHLATYSFGDAGMIKLIDSLVPPEAISSFQPIVNYLILERCPLETVRLWQMRIPVFSFDVLRNMEKLNGIELSYNRIERLQLSPNASCCQNLTLLDLSFNRLSTIDCALLSSMQALTVLQLSSNVIQELYGSLHLPNLTELDLSNNRIKSIDLCQWQIGSLKVLNVINNRIEHLFDCLRELQNLKTFQIAGNALTQLDFASFAQLRLVLLNFSRNRIEIVHNRNAVWPKTVCIKLNGNPVARNTTDLC
uniref:Leucine rich immune protein (Coil-less) n=1 Tax=Anopheles quadriannulatus TaxID=34691 RepID=A0A182WTX6_ANOQN